jgi:hypothetical protein
MGGKIDENEVEFNANLISSLENIFAYDFTSQLPLGSFFPTLHIFMHPYEPLRDRSYICRRIGQGKIDSLIAPVWKKQLLPNAIPEIMYAKGDKVSVDAVVHRNGIGFVFFLIPKFNH